MKRFFSKNPKHGEEKQEEKQAYWDEFKLIWQIIIAVIVAIGIGLGISQMHDRGERFNPLKPFMEQRD